MHYVDEGQGPPVVMLHGSPMWSFMYRRVIKSLCRDHRCIAVDLPGLGLSSAPPSEHASYRRNADLIHRFLERLELDDMTLIVHATAGPSAMDVAVRMRPRIKRLVISNTFAWPLATEPRLRRIIRIVSSRLFALLNVHLNLLPRVTARKGRRNGRFTATEREAILAPYRDKDTRRHLQELLSSLRTETDFLSQLTVRLRALREVPALILYGRHDNGFAAGFFDRWRELLPNHRAEILDDAGHFLVEDDPDGYATAVRRFLVEKPA